MIRCFGIQYINIQCCYYCWTSDARHFWQMLHGTHFISDVAWWGWCQIVLDCWSNKWVGERGGEAVISRWFSAASCYWLDIGKENKCLHKTLFCSCFICHFLRLFVTLQIILSYLQSHWVILSHLEFVGDRVADVKGPRDRRSPKGQGLLRKEGPPTYAILSQNLVLSRFTRFMNGHHRAFYESHPTLGVFSTKVS